jgi:hypothetical protein
MKIWQEKENLGPLSVEMKEEYKSLDQLRRKISKTKNKSRMRIRALWLQEAMKTQKFFHHFANGRKNTNTIWSIEGMAQKNIPLKTFPMKEHLILNHSSKNTPG